MGQGVLGDTIFTDEGSQRMSEAEAIYISHEEFSSRLTDPTLTVFNVLPAERYRDMHIPGTGNLPLSDVELKASAMLPDKGADIVLYCAGPT